ncbi:hypothetical protein F2Q69_00062482 [Brassica cretica]|uniref:DUF3511 domain-containing protein n=1 Tax=Brassica cretica TaxID=69181 RepID=A0A8S9RMF1_BRACR|nr:hypothetical protein F2Q69_00062482 [Brassica cretica]
MEIVNGKGYGVSSTSDFKLSIPPPPGAVQTTRTSAHVPVPWSFITPETKRKKRIATYKAYAMEDKVKTTVKKGFHWIKNRCSQIIH